MTVFVLFAFLLQSPWDGGIAVESSQRLFLNARSAVLTADERLLVTDMEQNAVIIVAGDNSIQRSVGQKGWGNDAFDGPTDITSTFLLEILVTDRDNERVQRFDKDMVFVRSYDRNTLGLDAPLRPVASAQSQQGEIFILDEEGKRVIWADTRGRMKGTFSIGNRPFSEPKDILISQDDVLFVLDDSQVHRFDTFGNLTGTIHLPDGNLWESISLSGGDLYVVSPGSILVHSLNTGAEAVITQSEIIGMEQNSPFRAAVQKGEGIIILTSTSVYRCSIRTYDR